MGFPGHVLEIERDPALRAYGAILASLNILAWLHWWQHPIGVILAPDTYRVCWPFLRDCEWMRWFDARTLDYVLYGWLALSVAAAALFASPRTVRWAWWALLAAFVVKYWLVFGDYRLRLNQHYMALWITAAFLFVPGRRRVLPYLVILFYFWAGLLKFSPEWISGRWTYGSTPLGMPASLVPAASVYVLVLEMVLVWGLLSRRSRVFWLTLAQLVVFHIASWNVVGFFYPMLMFGILALFPLLRFLRSDESLSDAVPPPGVRVLFSGAEPRSVVLTLAAFSALQLFGAGFPGDTAITGEGRWLALHMFDAPVHCTGTIRYRQFSGEVTEHTIDPDRLLLTERIRCEPLVYYSAAKRSCEVNRKNPRYADVDLALSSGRAGQPEKPVLSIERFCETAPRYDWWRHNAWIATGD